MRSLERLPVPGIIAAAMVAVVAGAVIAPDLVYDRFIWKHFWGPIVADAMNQATATHGGVVAHRGYTLVSELGYGLLLIGGILGTVRLLRRSGVGTGRGFALQFVPFIVAGGLLRVVEDAALLSVPARYLVISPIIYVAMFVAVGATVAVAVAAERRGLVADGRHVVAGAGTAAAIVIGAVLWVTGEVVAGWMVPATLGLATALFVIYYGGVLAGTNRFPLLTRLTGVESAGIMYGHLVDAAATVLSIGVLGYGEKHPVVAAAMDVAGTPFAFIPLKVAVIGGVLLAMTDEMRTDDPVTFNLVRLAVLAVGLGPGTRNLVRAVFGI